MVGSLTYARLRADLAGMAVGLFSRCMGANATFRALAADPAPFAGVRCLVAPLLLSAHVALECMLQGSGLATMPMQVTAGCNGSSVSRCPRHRQSIRHRP